MQRVLFGRDAETAQLRALIERVRAGRAAALALTGEPGAGKSALLDYAVRQGEHDGMLVLRARGRRSEPELSFTALSELLHPVRAQLEGISKIQAAALAGALALGPPVGAEPPAVYAAALSLIVHAAQDRPVLVAVDDAHRLDTASDQAIRFVVRHVREEAVGVVVAGRAGALETQQLPVMAVGALDRDAALALLGERVAPTVAAELVRVAGGNPLALVEHVEALTPAQLAGRAWLPDPLPVGTAAQWSVESLIAPVEADEAISMALLITAASSSRDVGELVAALDEVAYGSDALEAAEAAGLVTVESSMVEFRHALVGPAVYDGATAHQRRKAHRALAAALKSQGERAALRRAWHLAQAAFGPDERAAEELERAAEAAGDRAGYAGAAKAFETAAELTPPGDERARRRLRAAEASQLAGRSAQALGLLDRVLPEIEDPLLRAAGQHLKARIDIWRGFAGTARDRLAAEAAAVEPVAPELAAAMLSDAVTAAIVVGPSDEAVRLAQHAYERAAPLGDISKLLAGLQLGSALILAGERDGDALVARCAELLGGADPTFLAPALVQCVPALLTIEDHATATAVLDRLIPAARRGGAFGLLAECLGARGEVDARTGHWGFAYEAARESVDLARETGQGGLLADNLARLSRLEAAEGRERDCRAHADEALKLAAEFGLAPVGVYAESAIGLLELGLGHAEAAADRLEALSRATGALEPNRLDWMSDLIEACVRTNRAGAAERGLEHLAHAAGSARRPASVAAVHRARGLLADDERFAEEFAIALQWRGAGPTSFERARTQLCYGERLRRAHDRDGARGQLRAARQTFAILGAAPWLKRTNEELRASGERTRDDEPAPAGELTARELQVASRIAAGETYEEVAAALSIARRTVGSHVEWVYRKLDVRSPAQLAAKLHTGRPPAARAPGAEDERLRTLTPTEHKIARLAATGQRNKDIASTVFYSVASVEAALTKVYKKLDIRSRRELMRFFVGTTRPEPPPAARA